MKFRPLKQAPVLIAVCVIALVCLVRYLDFDFFDRLERMTYDWRARFALRFPQSTATNLGFVYMDEASIARVRDGSVGFKFGLYWPRQVYGRLAQELALQGAKAVAFDVVFGELRPDHAPVQLADGTLIESDQLFAQQTREAGKVIIAATTDLRTPDLFVRNVLALGDITTDEDPDGILRRARAFRLYPKWHPAFRQVEADPGYGVDLSRARIEPGHIVLPRVNGEEIKIPVDADNNFELADIGTPPLGTPPKARAFTNERVWHMGIVLAAQELGLDLANAGVELEQGRITLRGSHGVERVIPVSPEGYFYVDWCMPPGATGLLSAPIHQLLAQYKARLEGESGALQTNWNGKLVVVGSNAKGGNDLTDRGATPLEKDTLLASKHWNVANSVITGRFIQRISLVADFALIALLGVVTGFLTWQLRVFSAAAAVLLLALLYGIIAVFLYVQYRYWLPLVLPIFGVMLVEHVSLVTYRVVFEQSERRRIKSVFSKIVSPNVVNELLEAETLALGGARREITVLFADVRGFTELTDTSHERAVAYVQEHQLTGDAAEICFDESARETLNTVNLYLARVADNVKQHTGTLDKYIGDCVMAFWGAPTPNPKHALACVRAAIDAQRAIHALNQQRSAENQQLESENLARTSAGLPPKPLHAMLVLGTGINSGPVTVGLMGSDAHILNYTVFGREVNLASRLESVSGRGRIVISEATFRHLQRDDPALAATCVELPPASVKGFRTAVKNYEVPWRPPAPAPAETTVSTTEPK